MAIDMQATRRYQYNAAWLGPDGEYKTPFLVLAPVRKQVNTRSVGIPGQTEPTVRLSVHRAGAQSQCQGNDPLVHRLLYTFSFTDHPPEPTKETGRSLRRS